MTGRTFSTVCGLACLFLSGCSMFSTGSDSDALSPQDFAGPRPAAVKDAAAHDTTATTLPPTTPVAADNTEKPAPAAPAAPAQPPAAPPAPDPATAAPPQPPAAPADATKPAPPVVVTTPVDNTTLTVDAMIGQINGRPMYASQVLKPLDGAFRALSSTLPRSEFYKQVQQRINERMQQIVLDALFLGEAERILTEQERFGLAAMLRYRREELIRKFGNGSEATANEAIKQKYGRDLEGQIQRMKEEFLNYHYLSTVLAPKISITRRDIERYYNDPRNQSQFHSPGGRKIRMIRVSTAAAAERVDDMLKAGRPFLEVAASRLNQFNPDEAGKFVIRDGEKEIDLVTGEKVFDSDSLNKALLALKAGEHSQRITLGTGTQATHYWLLLESLTEGKSRSLADAQLDIEEALRGLQYKILRDQTTRKLFEEAGFGGRYEIGHPLFDMNRTLVSIAMNLYAPQ